MNSFKLAKKQRVAKEVKMLAKGKRVAKEERFRGKQCWWAVLLYFTGIFAAMLPGRQSCLLAAVPASCQQCCYVVAGGFLAGLRSSVAVVLDRGRLSLQLLCAVYICFREPNLSRPSHLTNQ